MTEGQATHSTRRREAVSFWKHARALLWSWDFIVGLIAGAALGFLPVVSPKIAASLGGSLLAVSGVAAAIAALVLTAMTVLLSVYNDAYKELLARVPGGIAGTLEPYRIVVVVASLASLVALASGLAQPAMAGLPRWALWASAALPLFLLCWAILGCIQTVNQLVRHVTRNEDALIYARRKERAEQRIRVQETQPEDQGFTP